jgi:hypothetical protein
MKTPETPTTVVGTRSYSTTFGVDIASEDPR